MFCEHILHTLPMLSTVYRYSCFHVIFLSTHLSRHTNVVYCFQISVFSCIVFINTYVKPCQCCLLFPGIGVFMSCFCQHIFLTMPMLSTASMYPCIRAMFLSKHISHVTNAVYCFQVFMFSCNVFVNTSVTPYQWCQLLPGIRVFV